MLLLPGVPPGEFITTHIRVEAQKRLLIPFYVGPNGCIKFQHSQGSVPNGRIISRILEYGHVQCVAGLLIFPYLQTDQYYQNAFQQPQW